MSVPFLRELLNKKNQSEPKPISVIFQQASKSSDFHQFSPIENQDKILISYYKSMVDAEKINRLLLTAIQELQESSREKIK